MPELSSLSALFLPVLPECEKLPRMESLVAASPTRAKAAAATAGAHRQLLAALDGVVTLATPDAALYKPLVLRGEAPLPKLLRVYLYNLTTHLSERQKGAFRIQITLGNAGKRERGHFDWSNGAFVVLAGYAPSQDVFALWDAGIYDQGSGIPFSRGCQVRDATLYAAMVNGTAEQTRHMRSGGVTETIVGSTSAHLGEALQLRWARTVDRLLSAQAS